MKYIDEYRDAQLARQLLDRHFLEPARLQRLAIEPDGCVRLPGNMFFMCGLLYKIGERRTFYPFEEILSIRVDIPGKNKAPITHSAHQNDRF